MFIYHAIGLYVYDILITYLDNG